MPLSNVEIQQELDLGHISITPFDQAMLQPASYDLKVGKIAATVSRNSDPRIDLESEHTLVIPGYSPAVIWTKEELKLPLNMVGHFGVKSGLSRRGLFASVGIQIDPGFKGPLSVSLMNLTPNPAALGYGESFCTLELERLAVPASEGYSGEYQNRKSFTAQELQSILGYKGHGLNDMMEGFAEIRESLSSMAGMARKFDDFLSKYTTENEKNARFNRGLLREMKSLVEHILGERVQTVVLRSIPKDQARQEILDLYKESKVSLFYSDVAEQLALDLEIVLELCTELENEGKIGVLEGDESKAIKKGRH
jgi:dCTP deaminase